MAIKVHSASFSGLKCNIIEVEVDISNGLPHFSIGGLGDTSIQESKDRIRSSIRNSNFKFPENRKTINLAPAQIRKKGSLFDLPIAAGILLHTGQIESELLENTIIIGELSLAGKIKKVPGVLAIVDYVRKSGFKRVFLPLENYLEARFINQIEIVPLKSLLQFAQICNGELKIQDCLEPEKENFSGEIPDNRLTKHQFLEIIGQEHAKRALAVAAAGRHNLLFYGSPGCGKTLLSRAIQDLLPPMSKEEILETTKIYSIRGLLDEKNPIISQRPFREIHHTTSKIALIGGGQIPKPGEISLAHNGILFLDEIAEFPRKVLETLRQPLEDHFITLTRLNFAYRFPANFSVVATMNPCPCGYKDDPKIVCKCSENQIRNYQKKLSGPLIDRFDLFLEIKKTKIQNYLQKEKPNDQPEIIPAIIQASSVQNERFKNLKIQNNSQMEIAEIKKYCKLSPESKFLLDNAAEKLKLSNRAYLKIIKLSRTIADLEGNSDITSSNISEALQYRPKNF